MASRKQSDPPPADEPSFEDAISALEEIVEAMEHDQLPLGKLVEYYEKGNSLLQSCESLLNTAKNRIELITLRNQEIGLESNAASGQIPGPASAATHAVDPDDDDDIRLF